MRRRGKKFLTLAAENQIVAADPATVHPASRSSVTDFDILVYGRATHVGTEFGLSKRLRVQPIRVSGHPYDFRA